MRVDGAIRAEGQGEGAATSIINKIYELDEYVPEEQKPLVEALDEALETVLTSGDSATGERQQRRHVAVPSPERDLEETKDQLRLKENDCAS